MKGKDKLKFLSLDRLTMEPAWNKKQALQYQQAMLVECQKEENKLLLEAKVFMLLNSNDNNVHSVHDINSGTTPMSSKPNQQCSFGQC